MFGLPRSGPAVEFALCQENLFHPSDTLSSNIPTSFPAFNNVILCFPCVVQAVK